MNDRIEAIAAAASIEVQGPDYSIAEWVEAYSVKFAELIIAETTKAFWSDECMTSDLALEEYSRNSNKIKEHFGL